MDKCCSGDGFSECSVCSFLWIQPPSLPLLSLCLLLLVAHFLFPFSPDFTVSLLFNETPFLLVSHCLSSPLYSPSVGSRWGLWDADSGILGSLCGPAQCITPPPPDALSRLNISHQSLCAVSPPWLACSRFCWHAHYHATHRTDHSLLPEFTSQTAAPKVSLLLNTPFQLISKVLLFVNGFVIFIFLFLSLHPRVRFHSFQGFSNPWLLPWFFSELTYAIVSFTFML